jgi:hypothetical protein
MVSPGRGSDSERTLPSQMKLRDNEHGEAVTLDNFDDTDAMADPIFSSPRSVEVRESSSHW